MTLFLYCKQVVRPVWATCFCFERGLPQAPLSRRGSEPCKQLQRQPLDTPVLGEEKKEEIFKIARFYKGVCGNHEDKLQKLR